MVVVAAGVFHKEDLPKMMRKRKCSIGTLELGMNEYKKYPGLYPSSY